MMVAKPDSPFRDDDGHPLSFEQIYDQYFQAVFNFVLHRIGRVAEAEDVVAQTFFQALRASWRFRFTGVPVQAWLLRIANNEVNAFFRGLRKNGGDLDVFDNPLESDRPGPDEELQAAQSHLVQHRLFLDMNRAIRQLPEQDQSLVVLRFLEQMSFKQIAQIMGKRVGTVTMRTHRALEKLKTILESWGWNHERFRETLTGNAKTEPGSAAIQTKLAT